MILTCPECATKYKAKSTAIGANGRTVRCRKCSTTWFVPAPDAVISTPDDLQLADMKAEQSGVSAAEASSMPSAQQRDKVETDDQPMQNETAPMPSQEVFAQAEPSKTADVIMRDRADAAKRQNRVRIIWLIWLIPLTLIGLILVGLFLTRQSVVSTFPGTAYFYNAVGVKVSPTGLIVEPPIIKTAKINGEQTIIINGAVKNISKTAKALPPLVLSLHNAQGESVVEWWVEFEVQSLAPDERTEFASEYPNPPLDGKELRYRLVFETSR